MHFTSGELGGLTLSGFAVWRAKADSGQNVTFSSRQFRVRGQRRSFSMLRWIAKREAQERLADVVWRASDDTASSQLRTKSEGVILGVATRRRRPGFAMPS